MSSLYYFLQDETGMCWGIFLRPYIVRHQNGFRKIFLAHCSGSLQFTELRLQLYKFFRKVRLYIVIAKVLVVDHIIDHYQANRQPVSGPHKVLHCVLFFSSGRQVPFRGERDGFPVSHPSGHTGHTCFLLLTKNGINLICGFSITAHQWMIIWGFLFFEFADNWHTAALH